MAISLEEMQRQASSSSSSSSSSDSSSSASTATAPGGTTSPRAKPSSPRTTISLAEMQSQVTAEPKGKLATAVSPVDELIQTQSAKTIAGEKLRQYEEARRALAVSDPHKLRLDNSLELAAEREKGVIRTAIDRERELTADQDTLNFIQQGVRSGLVSLPVSSASLAVGIPGGPLPAMGVMYAASRSLGYADLRGRGYPHDLAEKYGTRAGIIEAATELPFLGPILKRVPGAKKFIQATIGDVGGEIAAEYLGGVNEYLAEVAAKGGEITLEATWDALVAQNKNIPAVIVASLVMSGVQSGGMAGINQVTGRVIEATKAKDKKKAQDAFDELAAQHPDKAKETLAEVTKLDPNLAKYLETRIVKFEKASEEELRKIGEASAKEKTKQQEQAVKSLEPDVSKIFRDAKTAPAAEVKATPTVNPEIKAEMGNLDSLLKEANGKPQEQQQESTPDPNAPQAEKIQGKPGINARRITKIIGPQLYGMENFPKIVVKELLQNSFDAIKTVIAHKGMTKGSLKIWTNPDDRSVIMIDNGVGMSPEILATKFLEIAGTGKDSQTRNSGGLGIAKVAFLYGSEDLQVVTMNNGKVSTMETSGQELLEALDDPRKAPTIRITKPTAEHLKMFPDGHGTMVRVTVPESYKNPATGEEVPINFSGNRHEYSSVFNSPLFEDIDVEFNNEKVWGVGSDFPAGDFTQFANIKFDWGNAKIYVSADKSVKYGDNLHVLSNGIHQFSMRLSKKPGDMWSDPIPYTFFVDVVPKIKADDPGYPFAPNRQSFSPTTAEQFAKILMYINGTYAYSSLTEDVKNYGSVQYLDLQRNGSVKVTPAQTLQPTVPPPTTEFDTIKQGDKIEVHEGQILVNGKELPEVTPDELKKRVPDSGKLMIDQATVPADRVMLHDNVSIVQGRTWDKSAPRVPFSDHMRQQFGDRYDQFLATVGDMFHSLRSEVSRVMGYPELAKEGVGVSIDVEYRGVSIRVPFSGLFINPFHAEADNPVESFYGIIGTMIHEMAHHKVRNHDASFPAEMQRILYKMMGEEHTGSFSFTTFQRQFVERLRPFYDVLEAGREVLKNGSVEARGERFRDGGFESAEETGGNRIPAGNRGGRRADRTGERVLESAQERDSEARAFEQAGDNLAEGMAELHQAVNTVPTVPVRIKRPNLMTVGTPLTTAWLNVHNPLKPIYSVLNALAQNPSLYDANKKVTSHEFVDALLPKMPDGPIKDIFVKLRALGTTNTPIFFIPQKIRIKGAVDIGDAAGVYVPRGHAEHGIYLRVDFETIESGSTLTETLAHEMVHAATYEFIKDNPDHPLVKELNQLFDAAHILIPQVLERMHATSQVLGFDPKVIYDYRRSDRGATYGMSETWEFVAEAHGSEQFQQLLAQAARFDKTGIMDKFQGKLWAIAGRIARILRLNDAEAKMLHHTWDITNRIIKEQEARLSNSAALQPPAPGRTVVVGGNKVQETEVKSWFQGLVDKGRGNRAVAVTEGKLTEYWNQVIDTFAPEARGPEARKAGAILASAVSQEAQRSSMHHGRAAKRRAFWDSNQELAAKFIKGYERGQAFTDEMLKKIDEAYRAWSLDIFNAEQAAGIEYEAQDNYLYHLYENPQAVQAYFARKYGLKWGQPGFVKDRSFDLYEEAIAAGKALEAQGKPNPYKPKFTNPEDIMLARQHASDVALSRVWALNELAKNGLAVEVKKEQKAPPEGFFQVPRKSPNGKVYWVHERAQPIIHNLFDSKSLWSMPGMFGDSFRGLMYLKNLSVPIILGLDLFHPLHVLTIDNTTHAVRSLKLMLAGKAGPVETLVGLSKSFTFADIVKAPREGNRILKIVKGIIPESEITAPDRAALMAMAEGGFIPELSPQYRTGARHSFMQAFRRHEATAIFKLPMAVIDASQAMIFEVWIPALKTASYIKDCQTAVRADPTLLEDSMKRMETFRRLAKSIDNRYGEMAYNTMFWNRWVKDLGVASTLSLGWNLGFLREYGGAVGDTVQAARQPTKLQERIAEGKLDRPLFVLVQTIQSLAFGGLMTYLMSGDEPEEWRDYFYPKNGETNPDGTPQRVNTMFYTREIAAIWKHMELEGPVGGLLHIAMNKASPAIGLVKEAVTGVNYFGEEIRDPNAPAYIQLAQTLKASLMALEPIAIQTYRQSYYENPIKGATMAFIGFSKAPKYATESSTEGAIRQQFMKYNKKPRTPFERAEYSDEVRRLRDLYKLRRMVEYQEILQKTREKYDLTSSEINKIHTSVKRKDDPYVKMFQRLTWQHQKAILDDMTPEERQKYLRYSNKDHLGRRYRPPEED